MKNITVSVDEEIYRLARIKAAEEGTTVSALVRNYLMGLCQGESREQRFQRLQKLQDEVLAAYIARSGGLHMSENLPRDALYDRDAFR